VARQPLNWTFAAVAAEEEQVNSDEAVECDTYKPTHYELRELVRSWAREILDIDVSWSMWGVGACSDFRRQDYAFERIDRIRGVLGEESIRAAFDEVGEEARRRIGEDVWRIFTEGTPEEQEAFRDRLHRDVEDHRGQAPQLGETG
jgi:hypothetical protein